MWALLPLKNFDQAKQRLSGILSPVERRELFQAMVNDVIAVLYDHPRVDGVLLISDDPSAQRLADLYQIDCLTESSLGAKGLNEAVQGGVKHLASRGIDNVMVIHGDLPLVTAEEITRLMDLHQQQEAPALTIAPDSRQEGTNCLLCTPATALTFCYGRESLLRHTAQAKEKSMSLHIENLWGVSWDMDTADDLRVFIRNPSRERNLRTSQFMAENAMSQRIEAWFLEGDNASQESSYSAEAEGVFSYPQAI